MGRKQRKERTSKRVYFFVVEGCTEENYIARLKKLYRKDAKIENCKGGNANGVMQKAKQIIDINGDSYSGYIVWFDQDQYKPEDLQVKQNLEHKHGVVVYMSNPCVENWLIAHFQSPLNPLRTCKECIETVKRYIPNYDKNDCHLLDKYIDKQSISEATERIPELKAICYLFE